MRDYTYPSPVIAERIQEVFNQHDLTDKDIAQAISADKKSIGRYRRGDRHPTIKLIRYICKTYHVDANYLLDL